MRSAKLSIFVAILLLASPAVRADNWGAASQGQSSFRDLGPAFSVDVPVRSLEDQSRVVLLRTDLAQMAGLTGANLQEIAAKVLASYAVTTDGAEKSSKVFFSTKYQDHPTEKLEKLGNPMGDGRVTWAGEIQVTREDGSVLYLDVTLKGSGRTPLARKELVVDGKPNTQYSDGRLDMDEAARSYITSMALQENGVDSPQDIAVIEIPLQKINPLTGKPEKAAISVRMGNQLRLAHLRYIRRVGTVEEESTLLRYIIRRSLNLPLDAKIDNSHLLRYIHQFTANLANQAAHYTDMNFVHGSLTMGNQTAKGNPIDFGTFMALDAEHGKMSYLYDSLKVENQTEDLFNSYVPALLKMFQVPANLPATARADFHAEYLNEYKKTLGQLWLKRLGLADEEISKLSGETVSRFYEATEAVLKSTGTSPRQFYAGKLTPAAFDLREILKNSIRIAELPAWRQGREWQKVFLTDRSWATLKESDLKDPNSSYAQTMQKYIKSVTEISDTLTKSGVSLTAVVTRAQGIGAVKRGETNFPDISSLVESLRDPNSSLARNNELAANIARQLVDRAPATPHPSRVTLTQKAKCFLKTIQDVLN